ncbi:MAG: hypothetical protein KA758_09145 [Acidimicrobiales bacterium]|jgi:hypothetical protein|nr:hypothetical protein [Acidimicrobiales bacterium]HMS90502.1 hypothetical protein [Acidimicrobiales bacterium]
MQRRMRKGLLGLNAAVVVSLLIGACVPAAETYPSGGFPLRVSFGGGAQLSPAYEPNAAVVCSTVEAGKHLCRHIYGYEEGGANYTYYLSHPGIMSFDKHPTYGWELVTNAGGKYEGCAYTGPGRYEQTWICDYRANWHTFYTGQFSYLKTFKDWGSVVLSQATCSAAWGTWWKGALAGAAAWTGLIRDCGVYPYTPGPGSEPAEGLSSLDENQNVSSDPAVTVVEDDPIDPALPLEAQGSLPVQGAEAEPGRVGLGEDAGTLDAGNGAAYPSDPALWVVAEAD